MGPFLLFLLLSQAQAANACTAPEFRQFDFWVGEWVVSDPSGKQVGTNVIERIAGGCGLQENWTSAAGGTGRSINAYHAARQKWVQHWAGAGGSILLLEGAYDGGKMVLTGESGKSRHRITWSPLPGGKVRQLWEQSQDGGRTWQVAFDGTYSAKKP